MNMVSPESRQMPVPGTGQLRWRDASNLEAVRAIFHEYVHSWDPATDEKEREINAASLEGQFGVEMGLPDPELTSTAPSGQTVMDLDKITEFVNKSYGRKDERTVDVIYAVPSTEIPASEWCCYDMGLGIGGGR